MKIRVGVKLRSKISNKVVKISALLNSGYESGEPEITLPQRLTEILVFSSWKCKNCNC